MLFCEVLRGINEVRDIKCQLSALHTKTAHVMADDNSKEEGVLRKQLSKASDIKQLLDPQSPKGCNVHLLWRVSNRNNIFRENRRYHILAQAMNSD